MLRNIKWIALLTFALGYVVSTATAKPEESSHATDGATQNLGFLRPVYESTVADHKKSARWKVADIDSAMPVSFTGIRPNVINRASSLNRVFDVLCRSGRPLRVLQIGDSHVAGGNYPKAVRSTLENAWGTAENDSIGSGISFSYMGRNGATTQWFANREKINEIAAKCPDLIILSFGTNECHGMGYREELHRIQLEDFHEMLSTACPDAIIMITTPPGDYLTTRRVIRSRSGRRIVRSVSRINPMSVRCAAELESFGTAHGLAVWDLNSIAGGKAAVTNWQGAGMMRPDRIHFTPAGYQLHGKMLGEAILKAYNQYMQ